jgi:hypothetical protein
VFVSRHWPVVCLLALMTLLPLARPAAAQTDLDFDILLRGLDVFLELAAEGNGTPLGSVIFPGINPVSGLPVDHDANGIADLEQFALLGAVLRGDYTCGGVPSGTVLLDTAAMNTLRADFQFNKNRIITDMELGFLTCLGAGQSVGCTLIDILDDTPEGAELADLLVTILAS